MERKPRSLTVTESADHHPRILLKGKWLRNWGFTKGDQVLVTRTEAGDILIKFSSPANIWSAMRRQYRLEYDASQSSKPSRSRLRALYKQIDIAQEACKRRVRTRAAKTPNQL
ncbi:MAG TPA: hypothetical protein VFE32_21535 [Puia sp.]|jgi:hypothetical protein|nr:hypothetical protein [Puia sp.]